MPWVMSMLVLQPRMSRANDFTGVGEGVMEGSVIVGELVGDGICVSVDVIVGVMILPSGVKVKGRVKIMGVAVTMEGVFDATAVHAGKGWGCTRQTSQEVKIKTRNIDRIDIFFIGRLYPARFGKDWDSVEIITKSRSL